MIKRDKVEISVERRVLSNLIMSTSLMAKCVNAGSPIQFESSLGRTVSTWIWDYYNRTGEAPGKAIKDIYQQRAMELPEADRTMVCTYLETCSDEWFPTNLSYATDMALKYFQDRAIIILAEKLMNLVKSGDTAGGYHAISDFTKPTVRQKEIVSMFDDAAEVSTAFDNDEEEIFSLPGALGSVIGPIIQEDFIAFIGPPKSGKTWWLMAFAVQAALQGKCVLFISLEMSKKQMVRRFWQMLTGTTRYGEEVAWPVFEYDENGVARVIDGKHTPPQVDSDIGAISKEMEKLRNVSRRGRLELRNFATGTLSVRGLEAELKDMEVYEGFVPEVVCVDYADIMDLGPGSDEREKINRTWKALRGLASTRKCAVATVSQTGRATVGGKQDADENQISEDIRKVAHVTKMVTINHTPTERKRGITRLACNTTRDGAPVSDVVVCTSCLSIGRPYLECELLSRVDLSQEEQWDGSEDEAPQRRMPRRGGYGRRG